MKQIFTMLAVGVFLLGHPHHIQAQSADRNILNIHAIGIDRGAVNATRDFWKRHGDQHNEQWFRLQFGYLAEFQEGNVKNKTVYGHKGSWLYTIREYGEWELPEATRNLVKSTWFDYAITMVKEVRQGTDLIYVMRLEGLKRWMDVAVQDGEMRVIQDFAKP